MAIAIDNGGSLGCRHPGGTHRGRRAHPHPDNQRRRRRRTPDDVMARGIINRRALSDMELEDRPFLSITARHLDIRNRFVLQ